MPSTIHFDLYSAFLALNVRSSVVENSDSNTITFLCNPRCYSSIPLAPSSLLACAFEFALLHCTGLSVDRPLYSFALALCIRSANSLGLRKSVSAVLLLFVVEPYATARLHTPGSEVRTHSSRNHSYCYNACSTKSIILVDSCIKDALSQHWPLK